MTSNKHDPDGTSLVYPQTAHFTQQILDSSSLDIHLLVKIDSPILSPIASQNRLSRTTDTEDGGVTSTVVTGTNSSSSLPLAQHAGSLTTNNDEDPQAVLYMPPIAPPVSVDLVAEPLDTKEDEPPAPSFTFFKKLSLELQIKVVSSK